MSSREDEGFDGLLRDRVVEVSHDDYQGIRVHTLTLASGVEVSVVPMATLVRLLKLAGGAKQ